MFIYGLKSWRREDGFTLIEMIVSLAIFSFVVTIAVGSLIVLLSTNRMMQEEQSVMTNLSFALDAMTREIRTGSGYVCVGAALENGGVPGWGGGPPPRVFDSSLNQHDSIPVTRTRDCPGGGGPPINSLAFRGISFVEGGDSITGPGANRILYYFDDNENTIKRRVGNAPSETMLSSGLIVEDFRITVTGTDTLAGSNNNNVVQPTVTISIRAREERNNNKEYQLHTTVTQRILDL